MPSLEHVCFGLLPKRLDASYSYMLNFGILGVFIDITPLLVNIDIHVTKTKYFGVVNVLTQTQWKPPRL